MLRTKLVGVSVIVTLWACGGDSSSGDAGKDGTANDVAVGDVATNDAPQDGQGSDVANDGPPGPASVLMFGGSTDCSGSTPVPVLNETWSWNGTSWTAEAAGTAEYLASMATLGNSTMEYGGFDANDGFQGTTWVWGGTGWTSQASASPGGRAFSAMATVGANIVLFGGCNNCFSAALNDTWTWNGSAWANPSIAGPPSNRQGHAMATQGSNVVLFGGAPFIGGTDLADTWVYDGTAWSQKTVSPHPSARDSHAMATLGSTVVLFGGELFNGTSFVPLGETWIWDGTAWTQYTGTPQPSARFYSAMAALDATHVVLFGGTNASGAVGETWVWNGTGWSQPTVTGGPGARCGHSMATR